MANPNIHYLTDIHFDVSVGRVLPGVLDQIGVKRPMAVTDPQIAGMGLIDRLNVDVAAVYDRVRSNPDESACVEAVDHFRAHDCDGCVALGGGSSIDLAKAVSLLVHHKPPLGQYAFIRGGLEKIHDDILVPVVAVPTTAGSGSEVGRAALITLDDGEKLALLSPKLIPTAAICDPDLTVSMPASLTAATGMDAMSHCIENFCSRLDNAIADAIAIDGLDRAWSSIRGAVADGRNRTCRREMMLCALAGGLTFQKGLGAVHSLSHPMGALGGGRLHHGTLNAVFMPHVLRFNMDSCPQKMDAVADRVGVARRADLPDAFARLAGDLGLPTRLADMGVSATDLEPLAPRALADHCSACNPRQLSVEDCASLYAAAL